MAVTLANEHIGQSTMLVVNREDIQFYNVTPDRVRIEITVHNTGSVRSQPTPMHLRSAPFGAFVPWRPLQTLLVPPIEPGQSLRVTTEVQRPPVTPLGDVSQVTPAQLLTATDADEPNMYGSAARLPGSSPWDQRSLQSSFDRSRQHLLDITHRSSSKPRTDAPRPLAPDVNEQLGHRNPHWVGNIDVHIGRDPVERHRSLALRIHPGRRNVALFFVGRGGDAYSFGVQGDTLREHTNLVNLNGGVLSIIKLVRGHDIPLEMIREYAWLDSLDHLLVGLVIDVPKACGKGDLAVHVRQRSTDTEAIVEFNMDANAAGPGCYKA